MKEYHKINTLWKRDVNGRIIEGQYSTPEYEYLKNSQWVWTEKVDGTNIRVDFNGAKNILFAGRTDKAEIPNFLLNKLQELFTQDDLIATFADSSKDMFSVTLYGEGYGYKIQKNGKNYKADGVDFVLFDVLVNDILWLKREDVADIANKLGIKDVPIIGQGTLAELNDVVKRGMTSTWGNFAAEGIVARPTIELKDRSGNRIITKLKHKDFEGIYA